MEPQVSNPPKTDIVKIEIGGGIYPYGKGYLNVDQLDCADIQCDLNSLPWPFESDSIDKIYSSHCLEHLTDKPATMFEIVRICKVGAEVVLRLPHPQGEMAMVHTHCGVIGEVDFLNMLVHFADDFWKPKDKILKMLSCTPRCDVTWFNRARACRLFKDWTDKEIMDWVPRTAHENEFKFEVVAR